MNYQINNDVYVKIMKAISSGNFLNIQKKVRLTPMQVNTCLNMLGKNLLIKQDTDGYKLTQNGIQYLKAYDEFIKALSFKNWKTEPIVA